MECFLLEKKGRCSMSVEDRDWYKEDFKRKEEEYGGDFSACSRQFANNHSAIENDFQINNSICKTRLSVPFCVILA